ncbi:MAG: YybH family protein [Alphaproteobacteria bacterium]
MTVAGKIAEVLDRRAAAIAAKDVSGVLEHVSEAIVSFDVGTPLAHSGRDAVRERLEQWFAGYDGPIGFAIRDLGVHGDGASAFSHALVHISGTLTTGDTVSMWVRSTIGWERRNGEWMAVHEHMSDPMDFETGMARTDLTPVG